MQSRFGICNAIKRMRKWLFHAASHSRQHYTADGNLSCRTPIACRLVLQIHQLDYGAGTFSLRISRALSSSDPNFAGKMLPNNFLSNVKMSGSGRFLDLSCIFSMTHDVCDACRSITDF